MNGTLTARLAALLAVGYAFWVLASGPLRFGAGAEALTMRLSLSHPVAWLVGLVALVLGIGIWMRYAWAWWLGLAAALFQAGRILYPLFAGPGAPRLPGTTALLVLALLTAVVVLLLVPGSRGACSR